MENENNNKPEATLQDEQKKDRYIFGRIFGVAVGLWAILMLGYAYKIVRNSVFVIASNTADTRALASAYTGVVMPILFEIFFLYAAFAIFRKHKRTLGIVYTTVSFLFLGALLQGLTPKGLGIFLVIAIPVTIYFIKRKYVFKKCMSVK